MKKHDVLSFPSRSDWAPPPRLLLSSPPQTRSAVEHHGKKVERSGGQQRHVPRAQHSRAVADRADVVRLRAGHVRNALGSTPWLQSDGMEADFFVVTGVDRSEAIHSRQGQRLCSPKEWGWAVHQSSRPAAAAAAAN